MSTEEKIIAPVGDVTEASGSVKDQEVITNTTETKDENQYSAEFVNKVLKEKRNVVEANKALKGEIDSFKKQDLVKKENYKELLDMQKKEADELRIKYEDQKSLIVNTKKVDALRTELVKLGMDEKFLNKAVKLVELESIIIDDDTNVITGADLLAKNLSEEFPPLFQRKAVGVSHEAPVGNMTTLTVDVWKKLPKEERDKREPELYQTLGITRTK